MYFFNYNMCFFLVFFSQYLFVYFFVLYICLYFIMMVLWWLVIFSRYIDIIEVICCDLFEIK